MQNHTSKRNRGKSSEDDRLFGSQQELNKLQQGLEDMYFLLSRDYPIKSSLALVGNRYRLTSRQLLALQGMSCSEKEIKSRLNKGLTAAEIKGKILYLDGFNVLILFETLLSGGYVFRGLDGCYRDISSVHGTYRKVNQTEEVLLLVGRMLQELEAEKVIWVFDTPVSNSGKMKAFCYEIAEKEGFNWAAHLENSPDKFLVEENRIICSSDAWVLNYCAGWFNLGAYITNKLYGASEADNILKFKEPHF